MTTNTTAAMMPFALSVYWDQPIAGESIVTQEYLETVESAVAFQLGKGRQRTTTRALAINVTLYLADETEVYGRAEMVRMALREAMRLRAQGYFVTSHGQNLIRSGYMMDMISVMEGERAVVWGERFVYVRAPGKQQPTRVKELIESQENVDDHEEPWRGDLLSADPEIGCSGNAESASLSYCDGPNVEIYTFDMMKESRFAERYAPGKAAEATRLFFHAKSEALKQLKGDNLEVEEEFRYTGLGRLILIGVKNEVVEDEERSFIYRSHGFGVVCSMQSKDCTATKSNLNGLKFRTERDPATGMEKPTGLLVECDCAHKVHRQVRLMTGALIDKSKRAGDTKMLAFDEMSYRQRKAYESALRMGRRAIKALGPAAPATASSLITALSKPLS